MKTKNDLLELVNFAKTLIFGDAAYPVPLKTLTYYGNNNISKNSYKEFAKRKKSGGVRKIHAPVKGLMPIQKALNLILQCVFTPHQAATGFVPEKSIVDNARVHRGAHYVYNIDLKDFFPSIDMKRIAACLRIPPFNVVDTNEAPLAFLIANLCCTLIEVERKNKNGEWEKKILKVLPQGAPTSPILTNIICQRLDRRLSGLARRYGAQYTRYADDITFSSMYNLYRQGREFLREMEEIIKGQGFHINPKKTRLQKSGYRQEVTGLVVNEKVNVHRSYVKQIRRWLYLWERYGYVQAEAIFKRDYRADKGHVKVGEPSLQNVLDGKLQFLKMVKGEGDSTYLGLWWRFEGLVRPIRNKIPQPSDDEIIGKILAVLEKEGIGKPIIKDLEGDSSGLVKAYKELGFFSIETEDLEVSVKNKKKKAKENDYQLKFHRPQDVSAFLSLFGSGDHPFKYLVHDFIKPDETFNLNELIKKVEKSFNLETKKFSISNTLYARLKAFIGLSKEPWSLRFKRTSSYFSFSSATTKKWCKDNSNKHPIFRFSSDIKLFKEGIRIDGNLKGLINYVLDEKGLLKERFHIDFYKLEDATFYTDVDALLLGLGVIFNTIAQRKENSNKLKIVFEDDVSPAGEILNTIKIIHIESKCTKKLDEEGLLSGDLKDAKRCFYKLCDWSIIAENPNSEINKINILYNPSTGKKPKEKTETPIEGFTHVLTFYS